MKRENGINCSNEIHICPTISSYQEARFRPIATIGEKIGRQFMETSAWTVTRVTPASGDKH